MIIYPIKPRGGDGFNPPPSRFFPLLLKSSDDPYGCPYDFFPNFLFTSTHSTFKTPSIKIILIFFPFIKKNFFNPYLK